MFDSLILAATNIQWLNLYTISVYLATFFGF